MNLSDDLEKSGTEERHDVSESRWQRFGRIVEEKQARKILARRSAAERRTGRLIFGLGSFGTIGWTVTVPVLIGIAGGLWLDSHLHGRFSYTLMLLALGLLVGCYNSWRWLDEQHGLLDAEAKELEAVLAEQRMAKESSSMADETGQGTESGVDDGSEVSE